LIVKHVHDAQSLEQHWSAKHCFGKHPRNACFWQA
jgi:hypothetical protein